jgi:hypothetical protein
MPAIAARAFKLRCKPSGTFRNALEEHEAIQLGNNRKVRAFGRIPNTQSPSNSLAKRALSREGAKLCDAPPKTVAARE